MGRFGKATVEEVEGKQAWVAKVLNLERKVEKVTIYHIMDIWSGEQHAFSV